jgi:hypothetical protein
MTRDRSRQVPSSIAPKSADDIPDPPKTAVTGVAVGGLGTGANLEETQVLRTTDLEAFEGAELDDGQPPVDSHAVAPADDVTASPGASVAPAATMAAGAPAHAERVAAAPIEPAAARPRVRSSPRPARGLAGVLAIAFVLLAGMAMLATRDDGSAGAVPALLPTGSATTAETPGPDRERDDDRDKGKKCNGKGRGDCDGGGDD